MFLVVAMVCVLMTVVQTRHSPVCSDCEDIFIGGQQADDDGGDDVNEQADDDGGDDVTEQTDEKSEQADDNGGDDVNEQTDEKSDLDDVGEVLVPY